MKILITGGYGFIGSNLVNLLSQRFPLAKLFILDALKPQANRGNVKVEHAFIHADLANPDLSKVLAHYGPFTYIFHLAAETHVDRSLSAPRAFLESNAIGTMQLLEYARQQEPKRLIAISTDEVYGSILTGSSLETDILKPGNAYSAAKAAADLLCRVYFETYGVPVIVTRCCNNFGLNQHAEKFIPTVIRTAKAGRKVPVYDEGKQRRTWVPVEHHCGDLIELAQRGELGEVYNVGGGYECSNLEVARTILSLCNRDEGEIEFLPNARPNHDFRYSLNFGKIDALRAPHRQTEEDFRQRLARLV